jgi:hypothetical protein
VRSYVVLKILDILGREITTLISEELASGNYKKIWKTNNEASGIYFCRLHAGSFLDTKKLILIK